MTQQPDDTPDDLELADQLDDATRPAGHTSTDDDWPGPTGLDDAAWCARRLAHLTRRIEHLHAYAAREHARIDAWLARATRPIEHDRAYYTHRLTAWHARLRHQDPTTPLTVRLPGADLTSRKGRVTVHVDDQESLVGWAERSGQLDLLRFPPPEPDRREILRRYGAKLADEPGSYPAVDPDTGEVLPGVRLERAARTYTVRLVDETETTERDG